MVLQVFCSDTELGEYGEVIAVGDVVRRPGCARAGEFFGTELDAVPWAFDRYHFLVAGDSVTIAGRVTAIVGVFAALVRAEDGWRPRPGSAWVEPVDSTRLTRKVEGRIRWNDEPSSAGGRWGVPDPWDGDESGYGWIVTLADAVVTPLDVD